MTQKLPTLFISHGAPPLALDSEKGKDYQRLGQALPTSKAILVISAHWETREQIALGETSRHDELVYDFGVFRQELYELQYPAPGAPDVVDEIAKLLSPAHEVLLTDRGLDHGVWVPFLHMWPEANVPVLQMSLPYSFSNQELFDLGKQLAPLREQNILIVTTGGITHNLREINFRHRGAPVHWAAEFDQWLVDTLNTHDADALLNWQSKAPNAAMNHPSPEHFRPLLIAAGAAQGEAVSYPIEGFEYGSMSRRAVRFGEM